MATGRSFAEFVKDKCYNGLYQTADDYVNENWESMDLYTRNFVLLQSTIQLFVVIWRHIIAMAMDLLGVVESLQIFEYQSICMIIIANFEAIQPFALDQ